MSELQNLPFPVVFIAGIILGALIILLLNKLRSGSVSPTNYKQQMDDYQEQVESHFEETSEKFKNMAEQYQDLYQHMSKGATTLCRPENVAIGLADQADPLARVENKASTEEESQENKAADDTPEPADNSSDSVADKKQADSSAEESQDASTEENDTVAKESSEEPTEQETKA